MMFHRFSLAAFLVSLTFFATECSAQSSSDLFEVDAPTHGIIRPLPDGGGVVYFGGGGCTDSFSFGVADAIGTSWIQVDIDPISRHTSVSCVQWDGPVVTGVFSFLLSGSIKDSGDSPTPDPQNPDPPPANPADPGEYIVIIHVDQPGVGGDRDTWEGWIFAPDVGHAFIEIVNGDNGGSVSVGLHPNEPVTPLDPTAPGVIADDSNCPSDVDYEIAITQEQYQQLIEAIAHDRLHPPEYDLNDNNCTDYVLDVLDRIGIEIESSVGTWPGGSGHNPGDLGQDLIELVESINGEGTDDSSTP